MEGKIEYAGRRFLPVLKDDAGGTILQMLLRLTWGVLPFACKFSLCVGTHEKAGKVLLAKDFQANYASLTTFGHFMGAHQSLSKGTSASESAKLFFIASEYAFFQRHFMFLVTKRQRAEAAEEARRGAEQAREASDTAAVAAEQRAAAALRRAEEAEAARAQAEQRAADAEQALSNATASDEQGTGGRKSTSRRTKKS